MATAVIQPSFNSGEVSPRLFGHSDLVRLHSACGTLRNMFVDYNGGVRSRAGTAFVGYSKQTGRAYPPRLIKFQFSLQQGRILEFGNSYMRVILDGAFVTDSTLPLTAATNANPLVITVPASGGSSVTPINTGVYTSYAAGDVLTLAGGVYSVPAQLTVSDTELIAIVPSLGFGTGYAPSDTITLAGGTPSTKAVLTIGTTRVNSATVNAAGTSGTPGNATVTGTTGTGTLFSAVVLINSGGSIQSVVSISVPGSYSVNPTSPSAEPVTGGGLSGAKLALALGPNTVSITNNGVYTVNAAGGIYTQFSTSGSGTGAQFQNAIMGVQAASISRAGSYTSTPSNPVAQASTTGAGFGATFNMSFSTNPAFSAGDWLYFSGVGGMTQLNGHTFVVTASLGSGQYSMQDVYGNAVNSTAFGTFTSGGTAARIYTLASPYAEADLAWLKFEESADVVSITCVNQITGTEYPPYDLSRLSDNNWQFNQVNMSETISAPGFCSLSASFNWSVYEAGLSGSTTTPSVASYQYCVTAVNSIDGTESTASPIGQILNAIDISLTAGSVTVNHGTVPGAAQYNVYKATPVSAAYFVAPPPIVGALFGYVGTDLGGQFIDNNIVADFAQTPPVHRNPFARGQITGVSATAGGSGYTHASAAITTATGTGASIVAIVIGGAVVAYLVQNAGQNYASTDTVTISGDGSGATATLQFGAFSGTYPGLVSYLQERRVYAATINNPDTYWMSQPGAFTNFDTRIPTIDSDSVEGTPWGQQVNGLQWFIQMPGGAVAFTGLGAWFVGGQGSSSFNPQPITPSGQEALPETFNGCSATIPPIRIDYDLIFVQSKGSRYRSASIQYFTNIITGVDISLTSDHMFLGYQMVQHAWCEEPYKILWTVRNDGALLSLTYYKAQEVLGWARHDTYGTFVSVASVSELPVDALYVATLRNIPAGSAYLIERMDNRLWTSGVENTWCVDCGLSVPQPTPNAGVTASTPGGLGSLTGVTGLVGGQNYSSSTTAVVVDANGTGPGTGAVVALTIAGGIITGISFSAAGSGYTSPALVISDPQGTGSGASATITLNNQVTFTAASAVFSIASVGQVLRMGGGIATITGYTSSTVVTGNLTQPITNLVLDQNGGFAAVAASGAWTLTMPITVVGGLYHLIGLKVTGLMDGNPIPPTTVSAAGTITLPQPASAITVGLGFTAQLQSVYLDTGNPTVQGQRKKIGAATVRVENSRGFQVGSNQLDGSTVSPIQLGPVWQNMQPAKDLGTPAYIQQVVPLWTGDTRVTVQNDLSKPGQIAIQQISPLPLNVTAIVPEVMLGDLPSQEAPKRDRQQQRGG